MKEYIESAKTVDLAIEKALSHLNLTREEVSVEVIQLPQRKFLFGSTPAQVKITYSDADTKITAKEVKPKVEKSTPKKAETKVLKQNKPKVKKEPIKTEKTVNPTPIKEVATPIEATESIQKAIDFIYNVSKDMDINNITITPTIQDGVTILQVEGKNLGALIGRHGETMEALSYLASLVANRGKSNYEKISLDVAGYRSKREKDLKELAKNLGKKVAETGRSHTLDPMNPYERRIIHSIISEMDNVKSESRGEGGDRRIVIICTGENAGKPQNSDYKKSPQRNGRRPQGNRRYPNKRGANTNKPENATTEAKTERAQPVNDAVDIGLYGKIEI